MQDEMREKDRHDREQRPENGDYRQEPTLAGEREQCVRREVGHSDEEDHGHRARAHAKSRAGRNDPDEKHHD